MTEQQEMKQCFIIMPITTPKHLTEKYKDDADHFSHVLDCLFMPALKNAGFDPISPKSTGSDIIQASIINYLSTCELVLCDMSILNPNVFFEFGIRTALNKPVALVIDDKTKDIPFDTSIINFHKYKSSLDAWSMEGEVKALGNHIKEAYAKTPNYNALWKYFGISQTGEYKPEDVTIGEKIDFLIQEVTSLKRMPEDLTPFISGQKYIPIADLLNNESMLSQEELRAAKIRALTNVIGSNIRGKNKENGSE